MPEVQTNYVNTDTKNPAVPKTPDNLSDFIDQAKKYTVKAQAAGASPADIGRDIEFMYGLTQKNIAAKQNMMMTPAQQSEQDRLNLGTIGYNSDTGEYYNTRPGASANVGTTSGQNGGFGVSAKDFGGSSSTPAKTSGFDPAAFEQSFVYKPQGGQTATAPKGMSLDTSASPKGMTGFSSSVSPTTVATASPEWKYKLPQLQQFSDPLHLNPQTPGTAQIKIAS